MDPQSVAFQPRDDFWRFQSEMLRVQEHQAELADRVARLERKQEDDSRLKNVWGTSSPFPSVLGGTPQQVPLQQPTAEHFTNFDDQSSNLIGNLQLDADEEPRRVGATSRANSVRFDETANHGHWAHASRSSLDLIPRTGSSMGGHVMSERSYSHKSDGRQSSAGQSVHSMASGRANSLTSFGPTTPQDVPGLAPGLFILGSVPAIIRCWLNTNFKHDTLLYAAVCSGSYTSYLDWYTIEHLGFQDRVILDEDRVRKIKLSVYLPEAVPVSASSRSDSPAPQLPSIGVDFTVIEEHDAEVNPKAIQIFLGSDMLRAHNADLLLSCNQLTLYDDDRNKLQVPLVRPEDDRAFKCLHASGASTTDPNRATSTVASAHAHHTTQMSSTSPTRETYSPMGKSNGTGPVTNSEDGGSSGRRSLEQRPQPGLSASSRSDKDAQEPGSVSGTPQSGAPQAIWSNWRRDQVEKTNTGSLDWANVGKTASSDPSYQRRDTGIKVLKPSKSTRTLSTSNSSPVTGQSRFFDDGKRRGESEASNPAAAPPVKRSVSGDKARENMPGLSKPRSANPAISFKTASTNNKKRKIVVPARDSSNGDGTHSPNVGSVGVGSPRSSPQPSASPPRYLPPHLHDEVLVDTPEPGTLSARDSYTGASSPSEAYANLTLDSREGSVTDLDRTRTTEAHPQRPPPRASSPAKRLHSDMDDKPDAHGTRTSDAPSAARASKPLPTSTPQRSARATSVEMADAPAGSSPDGDGDDDATEQQGLPDIDVQVTRVMGMMSSEALVEGQEGYIISEQWLERVWARTSENRGRPNDFSRNATLGPVGPVDNSHLVDPELAHENLVDQHGDDFVALSKETTMGQDFEIVPRKAWDLVLSWYGLEKSSPVIRRYAHNTVPGQVSEDISYELHPPIFTIQKVRKTPNAADSTKPAARFVASRYESFVAFVDAAKKAAGVDPNNKVRIWRILTPAPTDQPQATQPSGILTPDASPQNGSPITPAPTQRPTLVMAADSFSALAFGSERELVTGKDETANETFNATLTLADAGLTQDQIIVLEEHDDKGEYIADTTKTASKNKAGALAGKGLQSNPNSGRSTPTGGPMTRGRKQNGKVRGHVGLTNLGNTCYMNSALQCLRSVEELSMYFLNNKWKDEVNIDNPIGFKGVIAKSYAGLLSSIYGFDNSSSVSPKDFKLKLGRANPMFSGYGQQDSQEFVSWLVDALHEDLNRIHKKPYRENPDSDDNTFRDPEAVKQLGEVYRENHRARNDSVAMDLFSGFYKNTMVCPDCEKVSITFDPYSQLTLQLPVEQSWSHTVTYVPLYGKPCRIELDFDKNATIKALKEFVGKRCGGVPANRIMASEVYSHKYYRHLDDASSIAESNIGARDEIYFYELEMAPSNWPAPKKKGAKYRMTLSQSSDEEIPETVSPLHDRVIFPLFHRIPSTSSYRATGQSMALWPSFIVLTREEAKDYDTILRKVLSRVAGMTSRKILSELSGPEQSRPGSDVVLTTEEDASPNDPQVNDGSVEGEDIVEVTMTDAKDTRFAQVDEANQVPEVLRPGSYIHPEFRALFEMKHTRKSSEIVTTGWSTVDYSKPLEPITKRVRIPPAREESVQSSAAGSETTSSDEDEDVSQSTIVDADAAIDAANVSSDEEMQSVEPAAQEFARSGRQNKKKSKKARKHERKMERKHKNNKNFKSKKAGKVPDQPNYPDGPDDESDERLLRMGEALVLDWNAEAYDALFGASTADDDRGADVMKNIEVLDDTELREKKERRAARRKNGINLDECFVESSKSEILSEDNAWYCSRCKERRRATKTLEIWTVPDILIIHLKRFSGARNLRDKIEDLVDFPVEGLDLSGKVGFPEGKDLTYDLFAVDNHYGGLGGGHYTATAQNFFDKQWYDYNDSIVSRCESGRKAVSRNAYLLFYRRRSPVPLGPPSLQQIVTGDNSNPDSDEDADDQQLRSRSPAGNGLRLDDSSRNGSSSAGAVAAGAVALRGGGYQHSAAANRPKNGVAAGSQSDDDDELPSYGDDEGYADDGAYTSTPWEMDADQPAWSFSGLGSANMDRRNDSDDDGAASDTGAMGSVGDGEMSERMQDFDDDDGVKNGWGGVGTPVAQQDDEVAEIRLVGED